VGEKMILRDWMKQKVVSISNTATIREAAVLFNTHHVGVLPVVDKQNRLDGVIRLQDLLSLELPDFFRLLPDFDFVHDFGAVETHQPSAQEIDMPVSKLMQPALYLEENCGLLRAYALMLKHDLYDLPIVNDEKELVGIASRVDIGTAIISTWNTIQESNQ
jgi:CBS domain-containing membrane protein